VHTELSEIKSRLAIAQQAAEQSRHLATDSAETSHSVRAALSQFDGVGSAIAHLQDDLRSVREALVRAQDDIHSLRQFREEAERHNVSDAERVRQDRNEIGRRFSDIERYIEGWAERLAGAEEHNRRTLDMASQVAMRLESIESLLTDIDSSQSRAQTTISRIDAELQRIASAVLALQSEDNSQRERLNTGFETIRRLEAELESIRAETNKISRIDDRLELVQAERTRHNERLNEIAEELGQVDSRLNQGDERSALLEARMSGYQDELRKVRELVVLECENIAKYLNGLKDLEADIRKRQIVALEKEIRDFRGRAYDVTQE
jgi:chromosome segregation ATPase